MSVPGGQKEKIIIATIACIERDGIQSLTNREIAREAGVNSAAINYYFGSKDNLIAAVINSTLNEMKSLWGEAREAAGDDPEKTVRLYLKSLFDGCFNYPGLTRAHLFSRYFYPDFHSPFQKVFMQQVPEFLEYLSRICDFASPEEGRAAVLNLFSSVMLSSILPEFYTEMYGSDFSKPDTREEYLDAILSRFMKN